MSGLLRSGEGDIVASMQGKECWTWAKAGSAIFLAMLVIAILIGIFKLLTGPPCLLRLYS